MHFYILILSCWFFLNFSKPVEASNLTLELGQAFVGSNNYQIPRTFGTKVELGSQSIPFYLRLRSVIDVSRNHEITFLFAPFSYQAIKKFNNNVQFNNELFFANQEVNIKYKFNSYRIGYRYHLHEAQTLLIKVGLTGKIRDASIEMSKDGKINRFSNVGFVPLLSTALEWIFIKDFKVILDVEGATGGKNGWALDATTYVQWAFDSKFSGMGGIRYLGGGASVKTVVSFAHIIYGFIGINYQL
jgi:hypothetical protein